MNARSITATLLALWLPPASLLADSPTPPRRPNIILLLADDLRYDAVGFAGEPLGHTPALDELATRGTVFRNAFVTTSICAPSRASIMTGQYVRTHGVADFDRGLTDAQWALTYPALLRAVGYHVGFVGKLGIGGRKQVERRAADFDYWRGIAGQGGRRFIDPADPTHTHQTARFGNDAIAFLQTSPADRPFCLSVSFTAPHARDGQPREFEPDTRDAELLADRTLPLPPTASEDVFNALPPFVRSSEARTRWKDRFASAELAQRTLRDYHRLVAGIDREVGRILAMLKELGKDRDTVVVFTSDNGWMAGDRGLTDKWFMYEPSIRVPLLIADPRVPEDARRSTAEALALNIDLAPTVLALAGVPVPASMQGLSLSPWLNRANEETAWREEFLYEHSYAPTIIPPSEGLRTVRWSYWRWLPPNPPSEELYDLEADPRQLTNLAALPSHAATLLDLRTRFESKAASLEPK